MIALDRDQGGSEISLSRDTPSLDTILVTAPGDPVEQGGGTGGVPA